MKVLEKTNERVPKDKAFVTSGDGGLHLRSSSREFASKIPSNSENVDNLLFPSIKRERK